MTTTYGTIPISSSSSSESPAPPLSNSKSSHASQHRITSIFGTCQSSKIMYNFSSFALPAGISDAVSRIRFNIAYFRRNYIGNAILFFTIFYPITFSVSMIAAWLFVYFLRRDLTPVIFGRPIDVRLVLVAILVAAVAVDLLLIQPDASALIIMPSIFSVAAAATVIHAALRKTDDLVMEEEEDERRLNEVCCEA